MTMMIPADTDFTQLLPMAQHAPDWGPPFPDPMRRRIETGRRFGKTLERELAYRARKAELNDLLQLTGGTGNLMVNICRSGTRQSAADKAARRKGGDGQTPKMHPNSRLRIYGIRAELNPEGVGMPILVGGTARQRACYRRAVMRYTG
jgi:hypothetical protein